MNSAELLGSTPMAASSGAAAMDQETQAERDHRLRHFGAALDALKARVEAQLGADDLAHVARTQRFSRGMELVGRLLIHFSFEPLGFSAGVVALWLHKQLQATEIGHTVLHGAYDASAFDGLPGAEKFRSKGYDWRIPIDEECWRYGHNVRHHGATNVAGKDADIHFGPVRLTDQTPFNPRFHPWQLLFTLFVLFPNFALLMNTHFTGVSDALDDNGIETKLDFLPDRSKASVRSAWRKAMRKFVPYYGVEYVLFPALAGPFFWKVLLGNWLSELMRDVYSAATIYCGHVGERTKNYPMGARPTRPGEWYAMQAEATNNFEVPWAVSMLCGGLDRQIEHHLFPRFAPERLREIAPEVRALCEAHGVEYRSASWGRTLRGALAHIHALSHEGSKSGPLGGVRAVIAEMA